MDRQWIMVETYQNILKAVNVYKCKRNVDANLMDEKVAKKLEAAMQALGKQYIKVVVKGK
jgi:hypothetical protein